MLIPNRYHHPVLLDNRDLREKNPYLEASLVASKNEFEEFEQDNGVIRDPAIINWIDCPCCGNPDTKQWIIKWGGRYDICPSCHHIFLKNSLKKEILLNLYNKSIADEMDRKTNQNPFIRQYWALVFRKYLSLIADLRGSPAKDCSILDVGCGVGFFLEICKEEGIDVEGLDVYDGMLDSLSAIIDQKKLHQVYDILEFSPGKHYDVVTMWGVLEHLTETQTVLNKCSELLADDGLLIVLVPNLQNRALRFLGSLMPTLNPRHHVNFYSQKSLNLIAEQSGFSVIGVLNELPIIDLMWPYIDQKDETIVDDIVAHDESYYLVYVLQKQSA